MNQISNQIVINICQTHCISSLHSLPTGKNVTSAVSASPYLSMCAGAVCGSGFQWKIPGIWGALLGQTRRLRQEGDSYEVWLSLLLTSNVWLHLGLSQTHWRISVSSLIYLLFALLFPKGLLEFWLSVCLEICFLQVYTGQRKEKQKKEQVSYPLLAFVSWTKISPALGSGWGWGEPDPDGAAKFIWVRGLKVLSLSLDKYIFRKSEM